MARHVTTRFAACSAWGSRLILAAVVGLVLYGCLWSDDSPFMPSTTIKDTNSKDVDLYRAIADRVRTGQGYYEAVGTELRSRGYATRPFFNWRLPLLGSFMGRLPSTDAALPVAGVLGGLTLLVWLVVLVRHEIPLFVTVTALLLMRGLLPAVIAPGFLFHELWAGLLVTLSIGLYGSGWRRSSVAAGVLALFIRELALPFVLIMLVLAWREKHRREALAWAIGLVAFGVYLAGHAVHVGTLVTVGDAAHEGWLQLNGWSFVLATARFNTLLTVGPSWLLAVAVPASLLGLIGWRGPVAVRAAMTVAGYVCAFMVVGRSCNCYWGMLYAPLLSLGFVYAPWALLDLLQAGRGARVSPATGAPTLQSPGLYTHPDDLADPL